MQDLPGAPARAELFAAADPRRRLPDGRHDGNPVAQARRRRGQRVPVQAVIGEHESAPVNRAVGTRILSPVEISLSVHPQIRPAAADHLAGDPVVINVRMGDDEPPKIIEGAAALGQCVADSRRAVVCFSGPERRAGIDAAVDERVAGRVGEQVGVNSRDPVNTERQREEEDSLSDHDRRHDAEPGQSRTFWQTAFH